MFLAASEETSIKATRSSMAMENTALILENTETQRGTEREGQRERDIERGTEREGQSSREREDERRIL